MSAKPNVRLALSELVVKADVLAACSALLAAHGDLEPEMRAHAILRLASLISACMEGAIPAESPADEGRCMRARAALLESVARSGAAEHCVVALLKGALCIAHPSGEPACRDEAAACQCGRNLTRFLFQLGKGMASAGLLQHLDGGAGSEDATAQPAQVTASLAASVIITGPCLQYAAAAHIVSQLVAADGGTRYGLAVSQCLPLTLDELPTGAGPGGGGKAAVHVSRRDGGNGAAGGASKSSGFELHCTGITTVLQLWNWYMLQTPRMQMAPPISRRAVHALSMRALQLALRSAEEHEGRRRRRQVQPSAAAATVAAAAVDCSNGSSGGNQPAPSGQRQTRPAGRPDRTGSVPAVATRAQTAAAGNTAAGGGREGAKSAVAVGADVVNRGTLPADAAPASAGGGLSQTPQEPHAAAEPEGAAQRPPLRYLLPEARCSEIALEALRCSALSARWPPVRFGADIPEDDARRSCAAMDPGFAAEWWGGAVAAINLAVTHAEAGISGEQVPLPYYALLASEIIVPLLNVRTLPACPPTNLAAALGAGHLPALERAMRAEGRQDDPVCPDYTYSLQVLSPSNLLAWLLAYGEPRKAAALMLTGAKLLWRTFDSVSARHGSGGGGGSVGTQCSSGGVEVHIGRLECDYNVLSGMRRWAAEMASMPPVHESAASGTGEPAEAAAAAVDLTGQDDSTAEPAQPPAANGHVRLRQLLLLTAHTVRLWLPPLARLAAHILRQDVALETVPLVDSVLAWVATLMHACVAALPLSGWAPSTAVGWSAAADAAAEAAPAAVATEAAGGGSDDRGSATGGSGAAGSGGGSASAAGAVGGSSGGIHAAGAVGGGGRTGSVAMWRRVLLEEVDVAGLVPVAADALLRLEERVCGGAGGDDEDDDDATGTVRRAADVALSALECACVLFPERLGPELRADADGGRLADRLTPQRLCRAGSALPEAVMEQRRRLAARLASLAAAGGDGRGEAERAPSGDATTAPPQWPWPDDPDTSRDVGCLLASVPESELRGLLRSCANPRCTNLDGDSEAELGLRACSGCGRVWYCGRDCQLAHWRAGHKAECGGRRV